MPFLGTDETYRIEFMFFQNRGTKLIGKEFSRIFSCI
jgi:hypothetical protein